MRTGCQRRNGPRWTPRITAVEESEELNEWRWDSSKEEMQSKKNVSCGYY